MQQCVILTKDEYESIRHLLHNALIDIREISKTYPCYTMCLIEQRVQKVDYILTKGC